MNCKNIELQREMNFEFNPKKFEGKVRLSYDFSNNYDKESAVVTESEGKNGKAVIEIIKAMDTIEKFLNLCKKAKGDDDFWGYNTALDLFYQDEYNDYWIRLLAVKEENNVYIKTYSK